MLMRHFSRSVEGIERDGLRAAPIDGTVVFGSSDDDPSFWSPATQVEPYVDEEGQQEGYCAPRSEGTPRAERFGMRVVPACATVAPPIEGPAQSVSGPCRSRGTWGLDSDDTLTRVYDDVDDIDARTMVFGEEPAPRCRLVRQRTGESYELCPPCVIGKGSAATLRVAGNPGISRQHARVSLANGAVLIEDLRSTNHSYVNGQRLEPTTPRELHDGDIVRLADETFDVFVS